MTSRSALISSIHTYQSANGAYWAETFNSAGERNAKVGPYATRPEARQAMVARIDGRIGRTAREAIEILAEREMTAAEWAELATMATSDEMAEAIRVDDER